MAAWLIRLAAGAVVGAVADRLANASAGPCSPSMPAFVCGHWVGFSAALGTVALLLGAKRAGPALGVVASALKSTDCPAPLAGPEPTPYSGRTDNEIAADEKSGANGAG